MMVKKVVWQRRHRCAFVVTWGVLLVAGTAALRLAFPTTPLWISLAVALLPAGLIADECVSGIVLLGWLPPVIEADGSHEAEDTERRQPKWLSVLEAFVCGGLLAWFGQTWYDRWRTVYPTTPGWMLYVTVVVLFMLAFGVLEGVLAEIIRRVRRRGAGTAA